jgi:2-dehydropantoate 2-reductase
MAEPRSIAVFGTGAMAMLFGARLARAGHLVTVCGRWSEGLAAIRSTGIRVERGGAEWSAPVATMDLGDPGAATESAAALALVLVKSHQTRRIGRHLAERLAGNGTALTLQNGLGNRELLEGMSQRPVGVGVTTAAAQVVSPGRVREVTTGRTVVAAEQQGIARVLGAAGFEVVTSRDVRSHLWLKLAVNCAINPVTALEEIDNGQLLERPGARRAAVAAASEVAIVAAALGIKLPVDPAQQALRVARATAANVSSMLQDVRRGAPTEIEALCGAVVARGRQTGVPTPVNESLLARVRRLERVGPAAAAVEVGA